MYEACPTCTAPVALVINAVRANIDVTGIKLVETECYGCDARTIWRVSWPAYVAVRRFLDLINADTVARFVAQLATEDLLVDVLEREHTGGVA